MTDATRTTPVSAKTETYTCQACAAQVQRPVVRGTRPKWCPACRAGNVWLNATIVCSHCGKTATGTGRKYCSTTCSNRAKVRAKILTRSGSNLPVLHHAPDPEPPRTAPTTVIRGSWFMAGYCRICSTPFTSRQTDSTCSPQCAAIKAANDKRAGKQRRRALKAGAFIAAVSPRRIYERDRWTCGICGKKIKRDQVAPQPLAPTIDHVIPLSRGGTHEPANARAAHFLCNARRGDRGGPEQLALIG